MAGTRKRPAEDLADEAPKAAKVAKTAAKGGAKGKRGPKTNLVASEFKTRALPLHVNLTYTPPVIPDDETDNATSADPGFIGTTALVPSVFSTGSYGWKGNKRITIELENRETGEKEKVHVMLTMNATVIGSKNAEAGEKAEGEDEEAKAGEEQPVEVAKEDAADAAEETKDPELPEE